MAAGKKLFEWQTPEIKNYWLNDFRTIDIAKKLEVSRSALYEFIKKHRVNKYSIVDDDDVIQIIQRLQQGAKQTWGYGMINAALKRKGSMFYILHLSAAQCN